MRADLVLTNGTIYTMDKRTPRAQALAIAGDRVLAVGDNAEMRGLLAPGGRVVDLAGRLVTPGLIDAHLHFLSYGLSLQRIDLMETPSLDAALEKTAQSAAVTPAGQWLLGRGWDQSVWEGQRFPTRSDLDRASSEHPILLRRKCGHAACANTLALQLAGIDAATPDPDGGEIERDPTSGEPTGILKETAIDLVDRVIGKPTDEQAVDAVRSAMHTVHAMGITGVHNMEDAQALRAFQMLREQGALKLRVLQQIPEVDLDAAIRLGLRSGFGDDWIRIGALKIFSDGSLGARTALMIEPYEGEPDNFGIAVTSAEQLKAQVGKAARAGIAVHIHAIGDRANSNVLDAIEATRRAGIGLHLRHRIEHAQVLHPHDLPRFAQLGVIASMQPIHCTQDMLLADANWGDRVRLSYAWSSLLSSGALLAFGSDAPVETPNVLQGIYAAVTRRRANGFPGADGWVPEECVSVQEAVYAYTMGAAISAGEERTKGSITPSKLADLTVLSQDIFAAGADAILGTTVVATIVGGQIVYDAGL
jgi:predicted amidohydrolase YtcJ